MSKKRKPIKWKMGRTMNRARLEWESPLVWWVRETEANRKIRELEDRVSSLIDYIDRREP